MMPCRKKKCRDGGGSGKRTQDSAIGLPVYECVKCGRRWAVGKLHRKKTTKPSSLEFKNTEKSQ